MIKLNKKGDIMFHVCVNCGKAALKENNGTFSFKLPRNYGEGSIDIADSLWLECQECGERILPPKLQEKLDKHRYRLLELLTPKEICEIRKSKGLTQQKIALILGVGEKTYTRWENGRSLQNKSSDTLIRLFAMNSDSFIEIRAQRRPDRNIKIGTYLKSIGQIKGESRLGLAAHGGLGDLDDKTILAVRDKIKKAASGS